MRKSKLTKSNDPIKILRMISRDAELERNDGKFVATTRAFKNKKKYNRKDDKREFRKNLDSLYFYLLIIEAVIMTLQVFFAQFSAIMLLSLIR